MTGTVTMTLHYGRLAALSPRDCPECGREIRQIQLPDDQSIRSWEEAATRVPAPRRFTVEPCGHPIILSILVEES